MILPAQTGAIIVSVLCVSAFAGILFLLVFLPLSQNAQMLNVLVGALGAGYVQTMNYWLGSSAGSGFKDTTINNLTTVK